MRTVRAGVSLVEVLLGLSILTMCVASIMWTLSATKDQWLRQDVSVVGNLLASSILDAAVHRFEGLDARYADLNTPPAEMVERAARGSWRAPFESLRQARAPVLGGGAYFAPDTGPPFPEPFDADERRFFERFSYEVRVGFDLVSEAGAAPVPLDADGDGRAEKDLARVEVEVFYVPPEGGVERTVCRLTTLVASRDKLPGSGVLGDL